MTAHEETPGRLHAECLFFVCLFFSRNVSFPSPLPETSTVMKESEAEGSSDARHRSGLTSRAAAAPLSLSLLTGLCFQVRSQ